jgi:aspartate-semialdehyde dehydrogenase
MRVAIYHPMTLLGKELREQLANESALASDVQLLATRDDEVGTLTDAGGAAAVVGRAAGEVDADLAFFCGPIAETRALLGERAAKTTAIVLSVGATLEDGVPCVEGVNLEKARAGEVLLSPHPAAVTLARLLHPLGAGLRSVSATVVLPVSQTEEAGLHELFEQTRSILAFGPQPPSPILGGQLAFNLVRGTDDDAALAAPLAAVLRPGVAVAVQSLFGGVFHGVSASAYVQMSGAEDAAALRARLADAPGLELRGLKSRFGPIDAAQSTHLLVGEVRADARNPGGFWLWATLDNLTAGGVGNALAIARAVS